MVFKLFTRLDCSTVQHTKTMWPSKQITRSNGVNRYTPNLTGWRLTRFVNYSLLIILLYFFFCHLSFPSSIHPNNKQGKECPLSGELGIPSRLMFDKQPQLQPSHLDTAIAIVLLLQFYFRTRHIVTFRFAFLIKQPRHGKCKHTTFTR